MSRQQDDDRPRQVKQFITTNDVNGKSVFLTSMSEVPPSRDADGGMRIAFCYGTDRTPPNFSADADVATYRLLTVDPSVGIIPSECVARLIDFPPGYESLMRRTVSLNYNFVVQGKVELVLDSGETRRLCPGDMVVQRAVNHAWRNVSRDRRARITAFVVPADFEDGTILMESGVQGIVLLK